MVLAWIGALALPCAVLGDLPKSDSELFNPRKVWDANLTFGPDQWQSIAPKGGGGGMFGGPGRPGGGPGEGGGRRGPGGPGGRGGFDPSRFMAGGWMQALDTDRDGKLTKSEFMGGFQRLAKEWDTTGAGELGVDALREGMNRTLAGGALGGGGFAPRLQGAEGKRNGLSSAAGIEFEYVQAHLGFGGGFLTNVAVRYKGNGTYMMSQGSEKKSLKVDLNEFVKGQKVAGVSKLNFHNNVTDASWMNEPLSYALYRDAGVPAPRTSYARLSVSVPGLHTNRYFGLYSIVENLDDNWAEASFGTRKGAIFKPVTPSLFQDLGQDWARYQQTYDPKGELTEKQKRRVIDFAQLVTHADEVEFSRRLPDFVDVDEFSRFMAVTVWLSTLDSILSIGQNYVVYLHPKTDRFLFVPWDLDHSFGNFMLQGTQQEREQLSIAEPWVGQNRFLERVMKVPAVREAYIARLREFQGTLFKPGRIQKQVDELAELLKPSVRDEGEEKLGRFQKVVAGEPVGMGGFGGGGRGPGGAGGIAGFGEPVKPIRTFVEVRHQSVAAQLAGTSAGMRIGARGGPFGGGGGGRGGFGPGTFLAPAILERADVDRNGKAGLAELGKLAETWWGEWDVAGNGYLTDQQLADGLGKAFPMPRGMGGPEAGGRPAPR
jgi:spore coat protein H